MKKIKVRIVCERVALDTNIWSAVAWDAAERGLVRAEAFARMKRVALAGVRAMVKEAKWEEVRK
jgi:hypothetical protein